MGGCRAAQGQHSMGSVRLRPACRVVAAGCLSWWCRWQQSRGWAPADTPVSYFPPGKFCVPSGLFNTRERGKSFSLRCVRRQLLASVSFCKLVGTDEGARHKIQRAIEHCCCSSSGITEQISLPVPGIVKEDPKLPEDKILPPPSPRPQNSIFDTDEEKSKVSLKAFLPTPPLSFSAEKTCWVVFWRLLLCLRTSGYC